MWQLKNSNCQKKLKQKMWQLKNSNCDQSQIVTKLKNSSCYKTQKFQIMTKLQKPNCNKAQKLKLWHNLKIQIATILNSNCDKTQKLKWWQNSKLSLVRTTWHLDNQWDLLWAAFSNLHGNKILMKLQCCARTSTSYENAPSSYEWNRYKRKSN